jgi:hypothetical protein
MTLSFPHIVMLMTGSVLMYSAVNNLDPRLVVLAAVKGKTVEEYIKLPDNAGKKLGGSWAEGLKKGATEAGKDAPSKLPKVGSGTIVAQPTTTPGQSWTSV